MSVLRKSLSISKTILAILYEVGEGTVKSFFPHPYSHLFCNHKKYNSFRPAVSRLQAAGLVARNKEGIFRLTKEGEKEAFMSYLNAEALSFDLKDKKERKWDNKWRIILFDVPEKKRKHRQYLRSLIRAVGFKEFQKSVWIYPYKIPDFLLELLRDENILPYTRFITAVDVDYDKDLRRLFKLPPDVS